MASSMGEHQGDILAENILAKGQESTHSAGTARVGKDGIEIAWAPWAWMKPDGLKSHGLSPASHELPCKSGVKPG